MDYAGPKNVTKIPLEDIHVWNVNDGGASYAKPSIIRQLSYYAGARDYIANSFGERHETDMEQDEVFQSCLDEARDFVVRELGYVTTSPVYFRPKTNKNEAEYYIDEDAIYTTPPQDTNDYLYRTILTSQLIHEIAHESSNVRRMFVFSEVEPNGVRKNNISWTIGMTTMRLTHESQIQTSNFFEEAFAETVASRWREMAIPGYGENRTTLLMTCFGVELPVKYHSPNRDLIDHGPITTHTGYPAIAAYGIELISEFTGVDIFELMKQARQPATEATAKREIIMTINSVQPGLYRQLRDLKYDCDSGDFEHGLNIIKAAISNGSSL